MADKHAILLDVEQGGSLLPSLRSARYDVVKIIGQGGMGIVYEAIDHERRERVALKTLSNHDPDALYRFKNEFRRLADLRHPNLVRLHELVMTDAEHAFFSMEFVDGTDFHSYVLRPEMRPESGGSATSSRATLPSSAPTGAWSTCRPRS